MARLGYGIIGTSGIALEKHLPLYARLPDDVEIVAACDVDGAKLRHAAAQYAISKLYTDYNELLADKAVDFVSVCLPNFLHFPVVMAALKAGKHVHCEKPMAMNAAEAREMLNESRRGGKVLMVGMNNRFMTWSRHVKAYLDSGVLGSIYFAKCGWIRRNGLPPDSWFVRREQSGGGALIDLGVHFIDLVLYFLGYPELKSVTAHTSNCLAISERAGLYTQPPISGYGGRFDVEDFSAGMMELKTGAAVSFEISWASNIPVEVCYYDLYGTGGGIHFAWTPGKQPELSISTLVNGVHCDIVPVLAGTKYDPAECREFISCIREGRDSVIAPPEQSVRMMELIEAIYLSAAERKQILF